MKKINIISEHGHNYDEAYEENQFYCPMCGKKTLAVELDAGAYYEGDRHFCSECGATFRTKQIGIFLNTDWEDRQRLEQLATTST